MLVDLIAAILLATAPASPGGDPQCVAAYGSRICSAPSLAPLRAEMADKFAAVLANGNRTATWQARHDRVLRTLRAGLNYDDKPMSDEEVEQTFRDHIDDLDKALEQAKGTRPLIKTPSARGETCMATWLDQGCKVAASGLLWVGKGRAIHWQLLDGASGADGIGAGVLLWEGSGHGTAKLIGWSFDGVHYEPPRITQGGMIWVPGRVMGTGDGNADLLLRYDEAAKAWQDIDLESWRDDLDKHLPKGFGIWKGVDYDFEGMGATSKLWRDRDGNCCPTGGDALIDFELAGRSLRIAKVRVDIVEKWRSRTP